MHATVHVWRSEDNSVELVLSFHLYLDSRDQVCAANALAAELPLQLLVVFLICITPGLLLFPVYSLFK